MSKEKPDGTNAPGAGAGQSGGGNYPHPDRGEESRNDGFLGHGGQTDIAYSGPEPDGDEDDNGVTRER